MANEPVNANNEQNNTPADIKELEAKIKALEAENGKLRQANTAASAEASKFKKQVQEKDDALKARMTEEERAKAESEAANAAMQQELETLRNERNIAKYSAALVANDIGMDAENAKYVAEALNAGETDKVFDGIRKFIVAHDKAIHEAALYNYGGMTLKMNGPALKADITPLSDGMKAYVELPFFTPMIMYEYVHCQ